ncbi:hypothetical protein IV203_019050 [Nitzschia inconspicua]|uniref:Uncharacterized protein n=1 Tax=Nitzschia inconspicua TaxID=303405 RepID=A0A9K3Q4V7_9STRA|nr:hypothetical protein IV203_019050 [Nitzschia inconspicua]
MRSKKAESKNQSSSVHNTCGYKLTGVQKRVADKGLPLPDINVSKEAQESIFENLSVTFPTFAASFAATFYFFAQEEKKDKKAQWLEKFCQIHRSTSQNSAVKTSPSK